DLMAEVSAASDEQAQGVDQVNTAVGQMDQVTQQNASNAEESSSASEELASQAQEMQRIVGELTLIIHGTNEKTAQKSSVKTKEQHKNNHSVSNTINKLKTWKNKHNEVAPSVESIPGSEEVIPLEENEMAEF
ncbi:MAG: methyl-accepting chemotaxis protein, partial [candidate division Zixibacteria bacterium]|nr:methyl-accepting chemotaxis protein [candidate division Zixibacteria bacterium]